MLWLSVHQSTTFDDHQIVSNKIVNYIGMLDRWNKNAEFKDLIKVCL
ncbi:hypothetical protein [Vibrio gallaecicus]|nr:hypothetical protein [Vibrio gallaecicus]MDN3614764.1 hypothetical protein [Vibrio gallaecicus]